MGRGLIGGDRVALFQRGQDRDIGDGVFGGHDFGKSRGGDRGLVQNIAVKLLQEGRDFADDPQFRAFRHVAPDLKQVMQPLAHAVAPDKEEPHRPAIDGRAFGQRLRHPGAIPGRDQAFGGGRSGIGSLDQRAGGEDRRTHRGALCLKRDPFRRDAVQRRRAQRRIGGIQHLFRDGHAGIDRLDHDGIAPFGDSLIGFERRVGPEIGDLTLRQRAGETRLKRAVGIGAQKPVGQTTKDARQGDGHIHPAQAVPADNRRMERDRAPGPCGRAQHRNTGLADARSLDRKGQKRPQRPHGGVARPLRHRGGNWRKVHEAAL